MAKGLSIPAPLILNSKSFVQVSIVCSTKIWYIESKLMGEVRLEHKDTANWFRTHVYMLTMKIRVITRAI